MGADVVRCAQTGRDIHTGPITARKSLEATPVVIAQVYCPISTTHH